MSQPKYLRLTLDVPLHEWTAVNSFDLLTFSQKLQRSFSGMPRERNHVVNLNLDYTWVKIRVGENSKDWARKYTLGNLNETQHLDANSGWYCIYFQPWKASFLSLLFGHRFSSLGLALFGFLTGSGKCVLPECQTIACLTRASSKSVKQECLTRVSSNSVPEWCQKRVFLQECQMRLTRVSSKSVPQKCQIRVSSMNVLQECLTRVPSKKCQVRVS